MTMISPPCTSSPSANLFRSEDASTLGTWRTMRGPGQRGDGAATGWSMTTMVAPPMSVQGC
jgi:hypothetical protein